MYCVKCGVRLGDGVSRCPLCSTPVWDPDRMELVDPGEKKRSYPDSYPGSFRESTLFFAVALTVLCSLAELMIFLVCMGLYGKLAWGGYALLGIPVAYTLIVLPLWFREPNPVIFVPCDFAASALYTLYVCSKTGGHWFLTFALPVIILGCLLFTSLLCLIRYIRGGRYYIFGGFFILAGVISILIEFFQHITFGSQMFLWSRYSAPPFIFFGIFLILIAIIKPMKRFLDRKFFY